MIRHFASPYLAGETIDEMAKTVAAVNAEGFMSAVSILGEFVTQREESRSAVEEYKQVLAAINERASNITGAFLPVTGGKDVQMVPKNRER